MRVRKTFTGKSWFNFIKKINLTSHKIFILTQHVAIVTYYFTIFKLEIKYAGRIILKITCQAL